MAWGLGFMAWGLGLRVWGLGFRVQGLGFRVNLLQGLGGGGDVRLGDIIITLAVTENKMTCSIHDNHVHRHNTC